MTDKKTRPYYNVIWTYQFGENKAELENGKKIKVATMYLDYVEHGYENIVRTPEFYKINLRHDLIGSGHITQYEDTKPFLQKKPPTDLEIIKSLDSVDRSIWENIVRFQMGMFCYKLPIGGEFAARNLHNARKREKANAA